MTGHNLKDFLESGAFLQTGPNRFKVLLGPFKRQSTFSAGGVQLYKPHFWSFLQNSDEQNHVYECSDSLNLSGNEFANWLKSLPYREARMNWQLPDQDGFSEQFRWSQEMFSAEELVKTVPIIVQSGEWSGHTAELVHILLNLLEKQSFGWSYGFFDQGCGFIGRSPELMAQWRVGERFNTTALAGTMPQAEFAAPSILSDRKIREEHAIVIEDIRQQMSTLSPELVVAETEILELPLLIHLKTDMSCKIENRSQCMKLINRLHPTAAMGLYPRTPQKMKTFSEFKLQQLRSDFAAPFVIVEPDEVFGVIAIRNLSFNRGQAKIFSGCGVTAMSNLDSELTELKSKRQSVKKMLGLHVNE